jgi:hypothetical protein
MTTNDKIIVNVSNGLAFVALTVCLAAGAGYAGWLGALVALPFGMVAMIYTGITAHDYLSLYYWEREQTNGYDVDEEIEVIDLDA